MEFKDKIKTRRIELGLTLEEVAEKMGVSAPTIQRYESGEIQNMRRDKVKKLADALNLSPSYLMGWEDQQNSTPTIIAAAGGGLTDVDERMKELLLDKQELCNAIYAANLDKRQIKELLGIVKTLEKL